MTNKEKYPNARVNHCNFSYGTKYYVLLEGKVYGSIYLVNGQPNEDCFYGWHDTKEKAQEALDNFLNHD